MTTIAFDGRTMAADTQGTDPYGMKDYADKILKLDFALIGCAGEQGQTTKWKRHVSAALRVGDAHAKELQSLLDYGYPDYKKDENDPAIMIVDRTYKTIWRHTGGIFIKSSYRQFAIGSGRDFAIAAMHCDRTAREAVAIAHLFDSGTGAEVTEALA